MDLPLGTNGERSVALIGVRRSGLLPFKIPSLRNIPDKIGMSLQKQISRSGFGFTHDGSVDSLVRFLQDSLELPSDFETGHMIAFLLCLNGSDLPKGLLNDRERPIGLESQDAHAAVGKQTTITDGVRSRFLRDMYAILQPATSRVDVIVKGFKDGVPRGWLYDRVAREFISDRLNERILPTDLESLATPTNPLTFTVVARNTGVRIGIDQDEDGFPDRTEVEAHSDPANPKSVPIVLIGVMVVEDGIELSWNSIPAKKYRIEFKDNLDEPIWSDLGREIVADSVVGRISVPDSRGHSHRYYRIRDTE
jgi:hypothetical protein